MDGEMEVEKHLNLSPQNSTFPGGQCLGVLCRKKRYVV